jgi:hypothetical protein
MSNAKGLRKGFDGRLLVIEDFETVKDALGRLQQFQRAALFGGGQVPMRLESIAGNSSRSRSRNDYPACSKSLMV